MNRLRQAPGAALTVQQLRGRQAEDAALDYLIQQGMVLEMRNFRCKSGEIDLIMRDRNAVVFIEVRARASSRYGGAAASVTAAKQMRLIGAAETYLQRFPVPPACRFDVIAFDSNTISWLRNAIER